MTSALQIYAGKKAKAHIAKNGLSPEHIRAIAGAAGGPKGLLLLELDKFIFGKWLTRASQRVDLVGASIGAWRMAAACMMDPTAAFERLARDYIAQDYPLEKERGFPHPQIISQAFGRGLADFFSPELPQLLGHPRYALHIVTSRGRGWVYQKHPQQRFETRVVLGMAAAYLANAVHRPAMGAVIERVVFSTKADLPFATEDYRTQSEKLSAKNFQAVLQASCSIPFVLSSVHDIPHAEQAEVHKGMFVDGGMTDYHLHMNYAAKLRDDEIVLYPHFQQHLVPGWFDKLLKHRHKSTSYLDHMVVLAPRASWVAGLVGAKLPDRQDFKTYAKNVTQRQKIWRTVVTDSGQLVDDFEVWLDNPSLISVLDL